MPARAADSGLDPDFEAIVTETGGYRLNAGGSRSGRAPRGGGWMVGTSQTQRKLEYEHSPVTELESLESLKSLKSRAKAARTGLLRALPTLSQIGWSSVFCVASLHI